VLQVSELSAGYGRVPVLFDISLDVDEGDVVALVGSNGAGKTTLLRAMSGMLPPSSGTVVLDGKDITRLASEQIVRLGIAHVPEGRRLFPGLTVEENLLAGAYHRSDGDVRRDFDRVLDMFPRLRERLRQVAGSMSGGEQQMCAIARGLMSRPRLLMVDELSMGLAPNLVDLFLDRLKTIAADGIAVLVVDQDVDAALRAARHGYVMSTGHITAQGSSEQLLADPAVRDAYMGVG